MVVGLKPQLKRKESKRAEGKTTIEGGRSPKEDILTAYSPHRSTKKRSTYHTRHTRSQPVEEIASAEAVSSLARAGSWSRRKPTVPSRQRVVSKMLWFSRSARLLES